MHKMADASGKAWQHRDLAVLLKHIAERNRLISSPGYRSIQAAYQESQRRAARGHGRYEHKAVLGPGPRAFGPADDEVVED
jgi:hypothetical protein